VSRPQTTSRLQKTVMARVLLRREEDSIVSLSCQHNVVCRQPSMSWVRAPCRPGLFSRAKFPLSSKDNTLRQKSTWHHFHASNSRSVGYFICSRPTSLSNLVSKDTHQLLPRARADQGHEVVAEWE
jgi:hypothetical protein